MAGADERQQKRVLDCVLGLLRQTGLSGTPPEIGDQVHRIVRREAGNDDPYQAAKEAGTAEALALYPRLKALVAESDDPLEVAIRLSIAGNIIDFGPGSGYDDLWGTVRRVLKQPFALCPRSPDASAALRAALSTVESPTCWGKAGGVLYLADNAGETVFDRVLIETLAVPVTYAVKGGPILNDATREDALAAGIDQVAEVISTGSDAPGTVLARCSEAFRQRVQSASVVIAKGQANYETLSEEGPKVFFLLQTKCPVIARDVGVPVGSIVLTQGQPCPLPAATNTLPTSSLSSRKLEAR
jgi:uncharacterized protein with ATP-grasp and redox domains